MSTVPRPIDKDYVTIVQQACYKVTGFLEQYKQVERAISISGKSKSILTSYTRQLAHLALHYYCFPLEPDSEQMMDLLHLVKSRSTTSATFFKFTVYGMRYDFPLRGLGYKHFSLLAIKKEQKLPVVLNSSKVKALLNSCSFLSTASSLAVILVSLGNIVAHTMIFNIKGKNTL